jgi:hypothetical protein
MRKRGRFFYTHKLAVLNTLLMLFVLAYDPRWLKPYANHKALSFYLGVLVLVGLFLEFAGIWYKTRFIYSHTGAKERKVPSWLQVLFFPRFIISGGVAAFALSGLGWLDKSDFLLLLLAGYAAVKEFWVRATLMNPENASGDRRGPVMTVLAEGMLVASMIISYIALWQLFLWDNEKLMYLIQNPINFGFVALLFGVVLLSLETPYLVEVAMRTQFTRRRWGGLFTLLLPVAALLAQLYRMGHLNF